MTTVTDALANQPVVTNQPEMATNIEKIRELKETTQLSWFFAIRDIKLRYRQTFLGLVWAVLQPVAQALVALIILGRLIGVPTDNVPYILFAYIGFLGWTYIQRSFSSAADSLVSNPDLVSKIYFPRLHAPIGSMLPGFVDLAVGTVLLVPLLIFYNSGISLKILSIPIWLILLFLCAAVPGIFFSAVNIKYRDVKHIIPFISQIWFYLTPIAYTSTLVPDKYQALYRLNPATTIVDGIRWSVIETPWPSYWWVSILTLLVTLFIALSVFSKMEKTFADVI